MTTPIGTKVQSLIFDRGKFNPGQAREWAERNGFKGGPPDQTDNSIRLRQRDPAEFAAGTLRTIVMTEGVKAVIGRPMKDETGELGSDSLSAELAPEVQARGGRFAILDAFDFVLGRVPPRELRVFRAGSNPSTKGTYRFTPDAAALVMAQYDKMGRRVAWDYDHGSLRKDSIDPALASKAAGSGTLEMRMGELWMTDIQWTPSAEEAIRAGEWLYFSPAFTYDASMQPDWLINIALTNNPALYGLDELAAASATSEFHSVALPSESVENQGQEKGTAKPSRKAKLEGTNMDEELSLSTYGDMPSFLKKNGKSKKEAAKAMGCTMADLDALMDKDETISDAHKKALGKMKMQEAADVEGMQTEPTGVAPPFSDSGNETPGPAAKLSSLDLRSYAAALGVFNANVTPSQVLEVAARSHAGLVQLLSATGTKDIAKAVQKVSILSTFANDVLRTMGEHHIDDALERVKALSIAEKEIKADREKLRADRVTSMLSAAQKSHQISPAEIEGKHGLKAIGLENPERLEAMLSARPKNATMAALAVNFKQPEVPKAVSVGTGAGADAGAEIAELGVKSDGTAKRYEDFEYAELSAISTAHPEVFKSLRTDWQTRGMPKLKPAVQKSA